MNWFSPFWSSATDVLRLWPANRKLNEQLEQLDTHPAFEDIRKLSIDNLKALAGTEWQRSKDLDDKLSKLTAVLSIALTISGVVTKIVSDGMPSTLLGTLAFMLMFLAMLFFFFGALIGFGGLRPKPKFGYGGTYLRILQEGGEGAEEELKGVVSSFQVANAIQANYGSAAIDLIRNGIITFALGIALSALVPSALKPTGGVHTEATHPALQEPAPVEVDAERSAPSQPVTDTSAPAASPQAAIAPEPGMAPPPTESSK